MGLERGNNKQERGALLRSLGKLPGIKEGMVAVTMLGASPLLESVHSDKAYAVEIATTETWEAGAQKLFREARENGNEVSAVFLSAPKSQVHAWGYSLEGGRRNTGPEQNTQEQLKRAFNKTADEISKLSRRTGEQSIEACFIHTHPQAAIERVTKDLFRQGSADRKWTDEHAGILFNGQSMPSSFNKDGILTMPPSHGDIYLLHNRRFLGIPKSPGYSPYIKHDSVQIEERHAVFNSAGAWYYRRFRSEDERENFISTLESQIPESGRKQITMSDADSAARAWMRYANVYEKNEMQSLMHDPAYIGLQYAYAKQWDGIRLEFAPLSEIQNRLSCSPEMKK